jgi:7-cyano-7-deazaguanine reductase
MPSDQFVTLETAVKESIIVDQYTEDPTLLKTATSGGQKNLYYHSSLLKSNCKVTHQPDWGDVFIYMNSNIVPDLPSLLKYIISFRNENHFHEEICETIFKRLQDTYEPAILGVTCLYVRRGGIDINPTRVSTGQDSLLGLLHSPGKVMDTNSHIKLTRQ